MAYKGSKGWYVKELKNMGIKKHPIEQKPLGKYKTYILRKLYLQENNKEFGT
ncbi:DUF2639 domain-containing protein [Bacillus kwashiorkori]|uniref:DUF2639 domain-containing protein n=1 Tax=Bacillus kwashiorkori TaxID=1522318 RepID=UPI00092FBAE0|nr:DUF2639 domain-containing protein [Bacillus kwashiorkori]